MRISQSRKDLLILLIISIFVSILYVYSAMPKTEYQAKNYTSLDNFLVVVPIFFIIILPICIYKLYGYMLKGEKENGV